MTDPQPRRRFRLLSRLAAPFRYVAGWFYYLPRGVRVAVVVLLVVGTAAGGYYGTTHLQKRARTKAVAAAWRDFEDAAKKSDRDAMRAALDRVLAGEPGEPTATKRKAALDSGAAADDDAEMAVLLVNQHVADARLADAAREAEKVLKKYPKDWQSRCVVAHHAVEVLKDREKAAAALAALPSPEDPEARLHPGGLLYALRLSDLLGRDAAPLRALIVRRLLPVLRGGAAAGAPAGAKVQLVECYLEPFADPGAIGELAGFWAHASKLADAAVTEAAEGGNAGLLVRIGMIGDRSLRALALIRDHEQMPKERFESLAKDVNDRTRRAWEAAKEKDPARPEPYRGLALLAARAKDRDAAVAFLQEGLVACGDRPELLELLTPLLAGNDPLEALRVTWTAAEKAGTDPAKWCLAANAAIAANRRDFALQACQNARKPPNEKHLWANQIEARLWLQAGEPGKAVERLRVFGPALRTNPLLATLHARALTESGLVVLLEDEFAAVVAAHDAGGTLRPPVPIVMFLAGVTDATSDPARIAWVAAKATETAAKWPDDVMAKKLAAAVLFKKAELTTPPWDADACRAALRAFDAIPAAERDDATTAARTALLQLRGPKDAAAALRTTAPLRTPEITPLLSPYHLEIVGAVLTANGKAADAVPLLERAVGTPGAPAGCWVQLALAYHATRRPDDARAAIERVLNYPNRSTREHAEYLAAKLLLRDNP